MAESTDKLICSICLNDFKQPKLIDCQHAFCLTCLEDYVNKVSTNNCFPCPLCRHYVSVPEGGVGEYPSNLDIAERPVCKMEIKPCDVCKIGVISECWCKDCQQHLCNSCKTIHDSLRGCQDHVLVKMDDAILDPSSDDSDLHFKDVCPNHHEKEVRCYCKDCSLAVCSDCFVTSHSSHIFVDLHSNEIDAQTRRELKSLKEELGDHISEFEKYCESVENVIADINNSAQMSCEAVDKQVDRICSVVTEFGEEFKVQIETSRADEIQKLTKHLGEIKISIDELKASVKYSVDVLDDKSIVQVLNRIQTVEEEKEETQRKKLVMPDVKYTCFEEGVIDETILLKHLGTVEIQEESTFTSSFNLADLEHNKRKCIYGTDFHIKEQGWYLGVKNVSKLKNSTLGVYLFWRKTHNTNCTAHFKLILMNTNSSKAVMRNTNHTYTSTGFAGYGWLSFIDWDKLKDKQNGYLNQNNNFRIKATVKVTKVGDDDNDDDDDDTDDDDDD